MFLVSLIRVTDNSMDSSFYGPPCRRVTNSATVVSLITVHLSAASAAPLCQSAINVSLDSIFLLHGSVWQTEDGAHISGWNRQAARSTGTYYSSTSTRCHNK